jgi:hypothetical protein
MDGVESARLSIYPGEILVKQALIRQVKSMSMSCDSVGNLLLAKFSYQGGKDSCVFIPASIVFWLLRHLPVNQDPSLKQPANMPQIYQQDWDYQHSPRALTVNCKQLFDSLRMAFELETKPGLTVVLDRANVELMRQIMVHYSTDLIDLDA